MHPSLGGYDSIFRSDHRPLFLDFNAKRFFDAQSFISHPRRARILRYTYPRLTQAYLDHALNDITSQKLDEKLARLAQRVRQNGESTRRDETAMNDINTALTAILLSAE